VASTAVPRTLQKVWREWVALKRSCERPAEQGAVCSELMLSMWGVTAPRLGAVLVCGGRSHDSL